MMITTLLNLKLLLATAVIAGNNCNLSQPPAGAGETQAHGVILYTYPRNHTIGPLYNGCRSQWFIDDGKFRKLNISYIKNGTVVSYDNLNINGDIAYSCKYEEGRLRGDSDGRCPGYEKLRIKTFAPGCYSKSELDSSGSYPLASKKCIAE